MTNKQITLKFENTGETIPVKITSEFTDKDGNTRYRGVYNSSNMSRIFEFYPDAIITTNN